jgi:hypothetical protein
LGQLVQLLALKIVKGGKDGKKGGREEGRKEEREGGREGRIYTVLQINVGWQIER